MFDRILKALSGIFNSPSATNSLHTNPEILFFNPFVPNALFLYPLKTSESRKVFWYFLGVEKECTENKQVNKVNFNIIINR